MRECLFCEFKIEGDVRKTVADRLMADHFDKNHESEIAPLPISVELDRKLLLQFGDLIDTFEEEIAKREQALYLMRDLSETFRKRIADAEAGIDRRFISVKEVMPSADSQ